MKNRIKDIRKEKRITQDKLVEGINLTRQYISLMEKNGESKPPPLKVAIVAATAYISLPVAVKIITSAIAAGAGAGVASLPDYLYVTSDVYTSHSVGKIYTRYENKYYLDSARTQYVGSWTFSKRWEH